MPNDDDPKRYYYYASERGCMKDPDSIDEIGVGINDGPKSCSLRICLFRLRDGAFGQPHFTMKLSAHNDEWCAFVECRDVLDLLANRVIPPGEMQTAKPFNALRACLEELGYKNLGRLKD